MANVIKLRKGLDINLKGKAAETYTTVKEPGFYALVPDDFPGVTPKVVVKEQEYVMAGGPLFIDKYHPEVKFVSPVSGVVTSVERGARRKVLNIVVEAAAEQDYEEFGKKNVSSMDADAVKSALLEAGLFAFIKQRPYDIIADPTVTPKGIFVSAFDTNPLAPDFEFALKGEEANFQTGLDALAKMAKTYLSISVKQKAAALTQAKNVTITAFDGPNPAGNVGVQINHLDPVSKGETVWTIDPQAVIFIGRLFNTGRVNFTRTVAVTGSEVLKPAYCKLQVGALLTNVFAGNVTTDKDLRYISGNVLSGKQVSPNGFLGAFHSQLTVIPEGDDVHEMFGWIMPLPLQMPPMRQVLPPTVNSTAAVLVRVSVVMIARFACSEASSERTISDRCSSMHSISMRWPITPVDATATSSSSTPRKSAAAFAMRRAFSLPSGAQAFALPEFATMARATPFSRCSMVT